MMMEQVLYDLLAYIERLIDSGTVNHAIDVLTWCTVGLSNVLKEAISLITQ